MSDLTGVIREWGAFGVLFVLALLVIRALFAKIVESFEARIRDLQCSEENQKILSEILGCVRQIQQQNRSAERLSGKLRGGSSGSKNSR